MKSSGKWVIAVLLVAAAAAAGVLLIMRRDTRQAPPPEISFTPEGANLQWKSERELYSIEVSDDAGVPVIVKQFNGVRKESALLVFTWESGVKYKFSVHAAGGDAAVEKTAPPTGEYPLAVELLVPYAGEAAYGSGEINMPTYNTESTVMAGGEFSAALIVTNFMEDGLDVSGEINIGGGLEVLDTSGEHIEKNPDTGNATIRFSGNIPLSYGKHITTFRLSVPREGDYRISARVSHDGREMPAEYGRTVTLHAKTKDFFAGSIKLAGSYMPTGIEGLADTKKRKDTVYIRPDLFKKLGRVFGIQAEYFDKYAAYTYQSLSFKNDSGSSMAFLLKSDIYYANRDETPDAFHPPNEFLGGRSDASTIVTATLAPGETTRVVLPVFVASHPLSGEYRRVINLIPLGATESVAEYELPMYVTSTNMLAFLFTMGAVVLSLGGAVLLVVRFRVLVGSMRIRWFVIISLYGAMSFAVMNIPVRIFGATLGALTGPFSIFITGFFSEILYFTLLVSLVRLIPRPGVVTLAVIVRYMMNGMVFGGFQLSDILFTGSSIVAKEIAFYVSGVTRKGENFVWTLQSTIIVALCLSFTDAYINLTNTYLMMSLYRLFYAEWYIWMNVIVNGFIYTFIATFTGKRFSDRLKWTDV